MNTTGVAEHPGTKMLIEREDCDFRRWQAVLIVRANLLDSLAYNEGYQDGGGPVVDVNLAEKRRAAKASLMAHIATLPGVVC